MSRIRGIVAATALIALLVSSGCGRVGFLSDGAPDPSALSSRMFQEPMPSVLEKLGYRVFSSFADGDSVHLELNRIGDHRSPFGDEEKRKIRDAIYGHIGYEFPLEIEGRVLGDVPETTGLITAIDGDRLLIVDSERRIGMDKRPDAAWYSFGGSDARLRMKDSGKAVSLSDLKIGYTVEAWSEGLMLSSYPGQTSGLELNIVSADVGEPDLKGTVKKLHWNESDADDRYLEVGEQRIRLMKFTQYLVDGQMSSAEKLREGDLVELRFIGYSIMPNEQAATQVVVRHGTDRG
ncbi:hypothetical protein J19TS2_56120 [Cohnella xylanilytica]|uniref:hypothetical protein n=1 Tax=Cohnella xylanilytica TaxID=557555 RepID=UPI001B1127EF|nr:hypothetical protein [Cohnella xylanilytica]GIO16057.1 hypothetical protein J19TS2_56120 [Cohnella xylanilytica]